LLSWRRHGAVARQRLAQIYSETEDERLAHALGYFYDRVESNEDGGEHLTFDLSVPANVTYTANGFISHNTISFAMDCDTTGIEPDIALVKYKKLVGGGVLKMVNQTVPRALRRLGYSESESKQIMAYIEDRGTIEGAPLMREEHLPVFDCAFRPMGGERSIHYMGHVKMMAATQPFISGAISKTVNLPSDITPDDIAQVYIEGWKMGLKALAIYRDGSKRTQPLSTGDEKKTKEQEPAAKAELQKAVEVKPSVEMSAEPQPVRRRLPDTRQAITHHFTIKSQDGSVHDGYITVGMYEDGSPGEIFVTVAKEGSTISGLMDAFATAISISLQYGVPLEALVKKFSHMRFEPSGVTTNPEIRVAKSLVDYIFRWLASQFLDTEAQKQLGILTPKVRAKLAADLNNMLEEKHEAPRVEVTSGQTYVSQADAPACPDCGAIMVRNASCYRCYNCGSTSGCS
jgi:ribonucleoside-diphosphate reductase alpha chain